MRLEILAILALAPLLSACGGEGGKVQSASAAAPVSSPPSRVLKYRQPVRQPAPPPPQVQRLTGLESVIGATTNELTRQFGPARLDVWEGDARKL